MNPQCYCLMWCYCGGQRGGHALHQGGTGHVIINKPLGSTRYTYNITHTRILTFQFRKITIVTVRKLKLQQCELFNLIIVIRRILTLAFSLQALVS